MPPAKKQRLTQEQSFKLLALTQQRSERGDEAAAAAIHSQLHKPKSHTSHHIPTAYVQPTERGDVKEREVRREQAAFVQSCQRSRAELGPPCCEAAALLPKAASVCFASSCTSTRSCKVSSKDSSSSGCGSSEAAAVLMSEVEWLCMPNRRATSLESVSVSSSSSCGMVHTAGRHARPATAESHKEWASDR